MASQTASRSLPAGVLLGLLAVGLAILASIAFSYGIRDPFNNPVATLSAASAVFLFIFAVVQPRSALTFFLWLAVTVDLVKRLAYAGSSLSSLEVAKILIVPVLLMSGIYTRTILLGWFYPAQSGFRKINFSRSLPILFLAGIIALAVLRRDGLSFSSLSANYAYICYIPAAMVIPTLLGTPERWEGFSRQLFWIAIVVGAYGIFQAIHGPLQFEYNYAESGLTQVANAADDRFRAYSTMSASAPFAGFMVIATLFALPHICRKTGRLGLFSPRVMVCFAYCLFVCALATQRGSFACGALTFLAIPLFRRPLLTQVAFLVSLILFGLMIVYIETVWIWIQNLEYILQGLRGNGGGLTPSSILTLGARVDSFRLLHDAETWSAFGTGFGGMEAHDMTTSLVRGIGWVGLLGFLSLVASMLYIATRLLEKLRDLPEACMWAEANLAVFVFAIVWSMLLGSILNVNPINFFFWVSIGNLLFLFHDRMWLKKSPSPQVIDAQLEAEAMVQGIQAPTPLKFR